MYDIQKSVFLALLACVVIICLVGIGVGTMAEIVFITSAYAAERNNPTALKPSPFEGDDLKPGTVTIHDTDKYDIDIIGIHMPADAQAPQDRQGILLLTLKETNARFVLMPGTGIVQVK